MECQSCNILMPDENNYCGNCGKPLQGDRILFKDLVAGGAIKAGVKITCSHKGKPVEATVQADGTLVRVITRGRGPTDGEKGSARLKCVAVDDKDMSLCGVFR